MRQQEDGLTIAALTLLFVALMADATLQIASQRVCSVSERVSTLQKTTQSEICVARGMQHRARQSEPVGVI